MKIKQENFTILGVSFAGGSALGTPLSVSEALAKSKPDTVLIIRRHDNLKSIETVCAQCAPNAAILEDFGPYSHQHWLCSYYDVPAISLRTEQLLELPASPLFVDFDSGSISVFERGKEKSSAVEPEVSVGRPQQQEEQRKLMAKRIQVLAQINAPSDISIAVSQGCDGFGEIKSSLVESSCGKKTIAAVEILAAIGQSDCRPDLLPIRFFDASPMHAEFEEGVVDGTADSALGNRGVRLFSAEPDAKNLFLEGLSDIGHNNFTVVLPMVNTISELKAAKLALSLPTARTGVQFETPMACLNADELLSEAGFAIIGMNDLTQYTGAWDRNRYHQEFTPHSTFLPQVIELAKKVCSAAQRLGITAAIAVDLYPNEVLAADLHEVSPDAVVVSPRRIKQWRHILEAS